MKKVISKIISISQKGHFYYWSFFTKINILIILIFILFSFVTRSHAQLNKLNDPGSLLVFPLIDNRDHNSIIEITNRSWDKVWLQCYAVIQLQTNPTVYVFRSFFIHLTPKETFWWNTSDDYNRTDTYGIRTQINGLANEKGFIFCWAVNDNKSQLEIEHNHLIGQALLYSSSKNHAWQYTAIPHQTVNVLQDRMLFLDGAEYSMATSQIMFEGFAQGFSGADGFLTVASIDINFDVFSASNYYLHFECWNQFEVSGTRNLQFTQFAQFDLGTQLHLALHETFSPKFQCATVSSGALWAVFHQSVGNLAWGENVWQHPSTGTSAKIILPPVPLSP